METGDYINNDVTVVRPKFRSKFL